MGFLFCGFAPEITGQTQMDVIAERMLLYQRASGGWPKQYHDKDGREFRVNYFQELTEGTPEEIKANYNKVDATYDNWATTKEIRYLLKTYATTKNEAYKTAAEKGIWYILDGQYEQSGGWPQYHPLRKGYYTHITFNDEVMSNMLGIMRDVVLGQEGFDVVDNKLIAPCKIALEKGIQCILDCQIKVDGKLTVWCAQHDAETLEPRPARAFELESYSGKESVLILQFLMKLENPSDEIITSIKSGMQWFEDNKIIGYDYKMIRDETKPRGRDRILVEKPGNVMWARFYDLETGKPFFTGRDGIKRDNIMEVESERRSGYGYYGDWPKEVLEIDYPKWLARIK